MGAIRWLASVFASSTFILGPPEFFLVLREPPQQWEARRQVSYFIYPSALGLIANRNQLVFDAQTEEVLSNFWKGKKGGTMFYLVFKLIRVSANKHRKKKILSYSSKNVRLFQWLFATLIK